MDLFPREKTEENRSKSVDWEFLENGYFGLVRGGWRPSWLVYRSAEPFGGGEEGKRGGRGNIHSDGGAHEWNARSATSFRCWHAQKPDEAQCLAAWKFDSKSVWWHWWHNSNVFSSFHRHHHCKLSLAFHEISTLKNCCLSVCVTRSVCVCVCVKLASVFCSLIHFHSLSHTHFSVVGWCVCVCV